MRWETVSSRVYRELHGRILAGDMQPGQPLPQNRLAKELGVGTNPLREAMIRLACEGMIEIVPQWGARVRSWTDEELRDDHELRGAIECRTARLCAVRAKDDELKDLFELGKKVDRTFDPQDPTSNTEHVKLDFEFHSCIARLARSSALLEQFDRVMVHRQMIDVMGLIDVQTLLNKDWKNWETHERVAEALISRDPDRADRAIRLHLEHAVW